MDPCPASLPSGTNDRSLPDNIPPKKLKQARRVSQHGNVSSTPVNTFPATVVSTLAQCRGTNLKVEFHSLLKIILRNIWQTFNENLDKVFKGIKVKLSLWADYCIIIYAMSRNIFKDSIS